jgi:hypothetical protein
MCLIGQKYWENEKNSSPESPALTGNGVKKIRILFRSSRTPPQTAGIVPKSCL